MKKAIALVLLLLAFTLAACAEKEGPATSATEPTAESTTAKSTEAVIPPLTVGMTYDEVSRLPIPHVDAFHLVFCRDGAGNSVVGEYDADSRTISSVRTFPAVTADSAAFASIALGMDIFDVVERVCVPFGMIIAEVELVDPSIGDPPDDPAFLLFACTDGTQYQIELGSNRRVAWIKQTPNPLGITLDAAQEATTDATQAGFDALAIGMTWSDVERLESKHLITGYYVFTRNASGDAVVGRFDPDTLKIAKITEYPAVTGDADAFASITPGMTVYDVVRAVGLPLGSRTFGLNTLDFVCSDGSEYRVQWNEDMTVLAVAPVPD